MSFSTVTCWILMNLIHLALPPGLTKDQAKSLLQRLQGRRDEKKFLLWKVQEFRSFVRVIMAMWHFTLARWPYHLAIVLLCFQDGLSDDFYFVVNSQELTPSPTNLIDVYSSHQIFPLACSFWVRSISSVFVEYLGFTHVILCNICMIFFSRLDHE